MRPGVACGRLSGLFLRRSAGRTVRAVRDYNRRFVRDSIVNALASKSWMPGRWRLAVLRAWGLQVGRCRVEPGCWFGAPTIHLGDDVLVGRGCVFDTLAQITIEPSVWMGMHVTFVTSGHQVGTAARRAGDLTPEPIRVGRGSWIGTGVTLLPGADVGDGCVIAAGAVVHGTCESNALHGGVPARLIRHLS